MKKYHITYEFQGTHIHFTCTSLFALCAKLELLAHDSNILEHTIDIHTENI